MKERERERESNRMSDDNKQIVRSSVAESSLNRSTVRARILLYLDEVGEASMSDIVDGIVVCYANVHGALNGRKGHYSKMMSLMGMGLVEARYAANILILYLLTEKGREAVRSLKMREG
jgi:predicted transcriptional regulator with HTH domain